MDYEIAEDLTRIKAALKTHEMLGACSPKSRKLKAMEERIGGLTRGLCSRFSDVSHWVSKEFRPGANERRAIRRAFKNAMGRLRIKECQRDIRIQAVFFDKFVQGLSPFHRRLEAKLRSI